MLKKNNLILIFILFLIFSSLISAYFIQYGLGYEPCKLCIYERIPYIVSIILILKVLLFKIFDRPTLLTLTIVFILSSFLAFYHLGIEQGFFTESFVCESKIISESLSREQLLEQLKNNNISCRNVDFEIFGLSLAAINFIFSLILSFVFSIFFINYKKTN
jgi:disulfide bond formation protein DsbB